MKQDSTENSMAKQSGSERVASRARSRSFLLVALGIALASLFAAAPAGAEPDFPTKLQALAKLSCTPTCLLCHTDPAGGNDHLRSSPDGAPWALVNFTFLSGDNPTEASLAPLDTKDSDGDSVMDLTEIRNNQDPLVKGDAPICSTILYGCGARIASKTPLDGSTATWLLTAAAACVYAGRRRLKSRAR